MVPAAAQCTVAAGAHHYTTGESAMVRTGRLHLPLDVMFFEDDRIIDAGDGGALLYLAMCLRIKQMKIDGRMSRPQIERLGRKAWRKELTKLVELRLVVGDDATGYGVSAWLKHNDPIAELEAKREADRNRKRGGSGSKNGTDSEGSEA